MKGFRNILTFLVAFFGFMLAPSLYAQTCAERALPACSQVLVAWPAYNGPLVNGNPSTIAAGSNIITATGTNTAYGTYTGTSWGGDQIGVYSPIFQWSGTASASPTEVYVNLGAGILPAGIPTDALCCLNASSLAVVEAVTTDSLKIIPSGTFANFSGSYITFTADVNGGWLGSPPQCNPIIPPPWTDCEQSSFGLLAQFSGGVGSDTIHFDGVTNFAVAPSNFGQMSVFRPLTAKTPYNGPQASIPVAFVLSIDNLTAGCLNPGGCQGSLNVDPAITSITLTQASGENVPITIVSASGAFYDQNGASAQAEVNGTLKALKALGLRQNAALDLAIASVSVSANVAFWQSDGNHVKKLSGDLVFGSDDLAVGTLLEIAEHNSSLAAELQGFISNLVGADRTLAFIAMSDAVTAGGNATDINVANADLTAGDTAVAANEPTNAIHDYLNAWNKAQESLNTR